MVPDLEEQWGLSEGRTTRIPVTLLILSFAIFKDSVTQLGFISPHHFPGIETGAQGG